MKQAGHEACLLLGSSIRPEQNIPLAVTELQKSLKIGRASSVWETGALGSDGPNFLNAALLVLSPFDMRELKEGILLPLEARLGRVRSADRNAARTMDIDIIFFDGVLREPKLWDYAFRAVPVAQLLPEMRSPAGETLRDAAARLAGAGVIGLRTDVLIEGSAKIPVDEKNSWLL